MYSKTFALVFAVAGGALIAEPIPAEAAKPYCQMLTLCNVVPRYCTRREPSGRTLRYACGTTTACRNQMRCN